MGELCLLAFYTCVLCMLLSAYIIGTNVFHHIWEYLLFVLVYFVWCWALYCYMSPYMGELCVFPNFVLMYFCKPHTAMPFPLFPHATNSGKYLTTMPDWKHTTPLPALKACSGHILWQHGRLGSVHIYICIYMFFMPSSTFFLFIKITYIYVMYVLHTLCRRQFPTLAPAHSDGSRLKGAIVYFDGQVMLYPVYYI